MSRHWRLIVEGKNDGYYNMAADEAILLSYPSQRIPTLRIYGWFRPFISIGYHQDPYKILKFPCEIPFVRRITGGAGILHFNEITYSLTLDGKALFLPKSVKDSYKALNRFLIRFYGSLGMTAHFACDVSLNDSTGRYGGFCFASCEHFDVLIEGKKIGGNAQRRMRNLIFQHGSIPQHVDYERVRMCFVDAGDFDGVTWLEQILDKKEDYFSMSTRLYESFKKEFGVIFVNGGFTQAEQKDVQQLMKNKYTKKEWNCFGHWK